MKWFGCALVMFAAGLAPAAPSDPMPLLAPLNPAFVQTQSLRATLRSAPPQVAPDGPGRGYTPSPVDRSHMIGLTPATRVTPGAKVAMAAATGSYPPSFDLRLSGHVTSVKDQGACGTCWSFSAIASMESDTLMGNGGASDFSENHLNVRHGFDAAACAGGNGDMAGAYMTRWGNTGSLAAGPVYEFEDPYTSTAATSVAGLSPGVHLQEFLVLPDRAIGSGLDGTDNANYKYAIQNYGAVDVAIIADYGMVQGYSSLYWNQANKALYYTDNGTAPFAHSAALVGWDDNYAATNFSTAPPGNGAFIVKNQWGPAWGNSGYFYISYYSLLIDAHVFRRPEGTSNYARSYLHDPFGQTSSYGYASDTAWGANVFTAVASETLQAVAFNTTGVNASYEISIYTGVSSTPSTGILEGAAVNTTGSFPYAGYHTVVLSRPVPVAAGQKFAVVVKFTTPGYTSPAPIEYRFPGYNSAASAGAGESFVSSNGTAWDDLGTVHPDANVNIRAFTAFNAPTTVPGAPTIGMATAGDASASVSFTPGAPGSGTLVNYTAVCGTVTATGINSPIIVTGLTNGTDYNCRVRTTSTAGTSAWSAVSNTVIPRTLVDDGFPTGSIPAGWIQPSGSSASWVVTNDAVYSGSLSLRSGFVGNDQESDISYTADFSAGTVSFARKVSSELNRDFLEFYIDGVVQNRWSGDVGWSVVSFPLAAGTHTMLWRYVKNSSVSSGSDAAWIDSVTLPTASSTTYYSLSVAKAGTGMGTVTSVPAVISCGAMCSASYRSQTGVTLTSTPAAGSTFAGWSGACTGTGTCTVTMDTAKSVTATFNAPTYALSVSISGTGSGTVISAPADVPCGPDCPELYTAGTWVTLLAKPAPGSTFAGWSGACTGTGACTVPMADVTNVTATFNIAPFVAATSAVITATSATITTTITFNAPDVGKSGSVFVTAWVPVSALGTLGISVATNAATDLAVLIQLTPSGWQLVVNGQLIPHASGVLGNPLAAQAILQNIATTNLPGAQFCLGYGTSAAEMTAAGRIQLVATIPDPNAASASSGSCLALVAPESGFWFNPNESGRGFAIEVQGTTVFMGTFLYEDNGRSTWYASAGPTQADGSYQGTMQAYGNGQTLTGAYKANAVTNANAGTIALRFSDATHGTLTWPGGTIPIERFVFGSGTPSFKPESGAWWNTAEAGRGYLIEVQGTNLWLGGYMYDDAGNPVWYAASGPMSSTTLFQGNWSQYSDGQTLTGAYRPPASPTNAGNVTLQFTSTTTATLTLPDARQIQLTRFYFAPAASP